MSTINRFRDQSIGPAFLHIDNTDLRRAFTDAAESVGADYNTIRSLTSGDNRMLLQVDMPQYTVDMSELGGQLTPRLWLKNDNTGRAAMAVGIGFFRWICQNGLYIGVASFGARIIHRDSAKANNLLDLLPAALHEGMEQITSGAATDLLLDAAEEKVTNSIDIVGSLDINKKAKDRTIDDLLTGAIRPEDNPGTVWGLYNIVNERVRKGGRSLYRAAVRDMDLLQDIQFLNQNQKAG